ncbi:tetratricopeptide repeat protein, partial [Singulisphaera rosea]
MLEESLAEDPADTFLRYGLALQCLRDGDVEEGRVRLLALIADHPDDQVAAYQQLGQSYLETEESAQAAEAL